MQGPPKAFHYDPHKVFSQGTLQDLDQGLDAKTLGESHTIVIERLIERPAREDRTRSLYKNLILEELSYKHLYLYKIMQGPLRGFHQDLHTIFLQRPLKDLGQDLHVRTSAVKDTL